MLSNQPYESSGHKKVDKIMTHTCVFSSGSPQMERLPLYLLRKKSCGTAYFFREFMYKEIRMCVFYCNFLIK